MSAACLSARVRGPRCCGRLWGSPTDVSLHGTSPCVAGAPTLTQLQKSIAQIAGPPMGGAEPPIRLPGPG
jgi:hypothetical protein